MMLISKYKYANSLLLLKEESPEGGRWLISKIPPTHWV
jgi:hypothetical protein